MAVNFDIVSDKVFKVIKGSGHEVKMYDSSTGDETVDPLKSRYFYVQNPNFMVNIDEETGLIISDHSYMPDTPGMKILKPED